MSIELTKHMPSHLNVAAGVRNMLSGFGTAMSRYGNKVWCALEASGAARAERELRLLAAHRTGDSEIGRACLTAAQHLNRPGL